MRHNLKTLRLLLEELSRFDAADQRRKFSVQDAARLAESFRDCRLEVLRLEPAAFSETQLHRLRQVDYRMQMVASGHGSADGIHSEAKRALQAFDWNIDE